MSHYQPGVCNLGKNEVNKRWIGAIIGFGLTIIVSIFLIYFKVFMPYSLVIDFIPLMIGFEGLYQAQNKFCVAFAARGIYNFYGTADEKGKVVNELEHYRDMQQAMKIHLYSVFLSILFTAIIMGVAYAPFLLYQ